MIHLSLKASMLPLWAEHEISRGTPFWREPWSTSGGKVRERGRLVSPSLGTKMKVSSTKGRKIVREIQA